jgi:elongation factor 2
MDDRERAKILRDHGWDTDESRGVWLIDERSNILTEVTKGVQRLSEVKGSITIAFTNSMESGPLAGEPVRGVKITLEDANIHEDPVHFGAGQMIPATRAGIFAGILSANPAILEPLLKLTVKLPVEQVGLINSVIAQKRGKVLSIDQKEYLTFVTGQIPASEAFDLSEVIRGATGGRAFWGTEFSHWDLVPASLQGPIVADIRKRKGMSPQIPKPQDLLR